MKIAATGCYVPFYDTCAGGRDDFAAWSETAWKRFGIAKPALSQHSGVSKWITTEGVEVARLVAIDFFTAETVLAELHPETGAIVRWLSRPKAWGGQP